MIRIKETKLKILLSIFPSDSKIVITELGDTWHPSSGFVDESILDGAETVQDVLNFDYDFIGLVLFTARIDGLLINLVENVFEISGTDNEIQVILSKINRQNEIVGPKIELAN